MKKKLICTYYSIILKKKRFSREHTKNLNANVRAPPDVTFWAVGYHPPPPPEFQLAFHIYYVKYKNILTCKRVSWNSGMGGGGNDVLKIFFCFLYV